MAKKQTFTDKANKKSSKGSRIKLIRSFISDSSGSVRFSEDILQVTEGKTPDAVIKEFIASK